MHLTRYAVDLILVLSGQTSAILEEDDDTT